LKEKKTEDLLQIQGKCDNGKDLKFGENAGSKIMLFLFIFISLL
jgi:hypothetical protein